MMLNFPAYKVKNRFIFEPVHPLRKDEISDLSYRMTASRMECVIPLKLEAKKIFKSTPLTVRHFFSFFHRTFSKTKRIYNFYF